MSLHSTTEGHNAYTPDITIYDLLLVRPYQKPWNPNVWKARYALNFKGIPYNTVWVKYGDVQSTLRDVGARPTGIYPDGSPYYTLPTIIDRSRLTPSGDPTIVSESFQIAEYLDTYYPTPHALFQEGPRDIERLFYNQFIESVFRAVTPALLPEVFSRVEDGSRPYYRKTREPRLGGKIEEVCPKGTPKWDECWNNVHKGLNGLAAFDTHGSNDRIAFSDFVIASLLETVYVFFNDEWHYRVSLWDGGKWKQLRDRCAPYRITPGADEAQTIIARL